MNWLQAFWKKLTAPPPSATPKTYTSTTAAKGLVPVVAKPAPAPKVAEESLANFTPRAQQALALARKEADRLNHHFVGTEHVLLGLMKLGQGVAVNVLGKMGLNLETLRAEIEKQVGPGPDGKMIGNIPYTPRVKKVLAFAVKEAKALNHTYVGTEHILLGLLREGDGVSARVLRNFGIDAEQTRQAILKELDPYWINAVPRFELRGSAPSAPPVDRSELRRDRFTPRVRRTFTLALEEAERRKQRFVETEHVLLGLLRMGQGVAAHVLIKIGVNAEIVADRIEDGPAPGVHKDEPPLFSPLVKEVLAFAAEEARALEHTYIGTEHILLGLLRQPHGGASRILKDLYVDPEALRKQVLLAFEVKKIEPAGPAGDKDVQPSEKDTEMYAKKTSPGQNPGSASGTGLAPVPLNPTREPVDIDKRYDVYCVEHEKIVIHRNVRFKATQSLLPRSEDDHGSDFVELEQPDGQSVFVAKSTIIRFCAAGVKPEIEDL